MITLVFYVWLILAVFSLLGLVEAMPVPDQPQPDEPEEGDE